jgi:hypothetical protein
MKAMSTAILVLALTPFVLGQDTTTTAKPNGAGSDVKTAAKDTGKGVKTAAKDTGKGVKVAAKDTGKGAEVAAKDTGKGAKVVGKDTAKGVKKVGGAMKGDKPADTKPADPAK